MFWKESFRIKYLWMKWQYCKILYTFLDLDIILLKTISLILPSVHIFKSLVLMSTVFFKEGGSKFWLPPPEGGIWKNQRKVWKYAAGAGPLKKKGLILFLFHFLRFIIFTFRNYPLQNCYAFQEKLFFYVTIILWKKVILSCLKMNLKISHDLRWPICKGV